jgi:phosphoenolpyruvate carboxylase
VLSLPNVQLGAEASSLRDDLVGIATRLTQPLTAWQAAQTSRNQRLSSRLMNEYRNRIRPLANVFSRIADLLPDETE